MPSSPSASNRRRFLGSAIVGLATAPLLKTHSAEPSRTSTPSDGFTIPSENVPLTNDADVIVCGAGPAGIAAAITAARAGAKVRLFEWRGCLGGIWTAGLLGYFLDFDKPGLSKELRTKLDQRGAYTGHRPGSFSYDPEALKLLLEELCVEAGIQFQYHTRVAAAFKEGRQLTTIITDSKAGREAWRASVFIDTTGDGDLAAQAGCSFDLGDPAYGDGNSTVTCPCQPMSLNALLTVRNPEALREFIRFGNPLEGENTNDQKKNRIREIIETTGHFPSYSKPTLWHVKENLVFAMLNHEYGVKPFDAAAVTQATVNARKEMNKMVDGLRQLGGPWEGIQLVATAEQIGVRDGRRIAGRYTVTKDDVINGSRYDDGVTRATFSVDIHATTAEHNQKSATHATGIKVKPYDIPLRALIARDVDGLMMAGRCISGDFISHSSYRVTGNAVAMGEAAGATAAIAAKTKRQPHEVPWSEGKEQLTKIAAG
ncbi:FAD-dependent oxidoreductase [Phragmitibacter flavus]|uniref:FAD-dependent oxidoreductase n=1 Tax=Phragmitibacter flavus TaxID=2576071 RepID=A0A5R8KC96_9BACT|nr:FAD-dependent oxidoreductase [Phragmitibacter flavus]TLD69918.1 FAD-dependent oxidoreductase [Phragmitibacter flavus]